MQYQHWKEPCARTRFDTLLARVQQAQLLASIRNELLVERQRDGVWCRDNEQFCVVPVAASGRPGRIAPPNAWAESIQRRTSALSDYELDVVPRIRADVCAPDSGHW